MHIKPLEAGNRTDGRVELYSMQQATVPLTPEQILEQLRALSTAERLKVAEQIIREAADEVTPGAEALWRAEIQRRIDAIEAGTAELEEWDAVRGRLQAAVEK